MKCLISAFLLLSMSAFAQVDTKGVQVSETLKRLFPDGNKQNLLANMDDLTERWNALFDEQNLDSDDVKHRMNWRELFPIRTKQFHLIEGSRTFYNVAPKKYRYEITEDPQTNQLIVEVRMHFYPAPEVLKKIGASEPVPKYKAGLEGLMLAVESNVFEAQRIWNSQAPEGVAFRFKMARDKSEAHYSLELRTKFGALYDKFIMAPAYPETLAHEIGHMMGLDDEYKVITSNVVPWNELVRRGKPFEYTAYQDMRCNLASIMCLRGTVYPYHIGHIMGRIVPSSNPQ